MQLLAEARFVKRDSSPQETGRLLDETTRENKLWPWKQMDRS